MEVTKSSDIEDDLLWLQDNVFEFQSFYEPETIAYICNIFKSKWISNSSSDEKEESQAQKQKRFVEFTYFKHTSPMII